MPKARRTKSSRPKVPLARIKLEVNFYVLNSNSVVHNFPWHFCEQVDPITSGGIPSSLIILLQFGAVAYMENPWQYKGGIIMEESPNEISPQYMEDD